MIVNRIQLAEFLGVSGPTVDARVERGMPIKTKGKKGQQSEFETADVLDWHVNHKITRDNPRGIFAEEYEDPAKNSARELQRRKLQAETEMAEIELAKKRELVVLVEDAVSEISAAVANLRAQLLNLPRRAAPLIVGETDVDNVKDTLDREVNELLQELHNDATRGAEELTTSD